MQHEISSIDRMVIKILIRNSRISVKDISRQLGISQPTVKKRITQMLDSGIIQNFACNIDMAKFGYNLTFITMVRIVNANNSEKIAYKLMKISSISSVDMITGEYDLILRGYAKNQDDLYYILSKIQSIEGIDHLFTNIVIKSLGNKTVIPE
ncbi:MULTISPECIES: Lrp/AsnC family transcriptional regulator [Acidiplasma]|jgi:DNA-binding Lrp family transcriptional regulator|nr:MULTISPECIES: Lrp/AsnC family transcriptional regulator [Acidiplasma]WMT55168.1 MAG: Lrp/AsnC family transcriptional regulator [Acidiplasma sp.]